MCQNIYTLPLNRYNQNIKRGRKFFCSPKCVTDYNKTGKVINCLNCNIEVYTTQNIFCSRSCSATYRNTHKTKGTRRSKLELWLEAKLTELYPTLLIQFNKKDTIGSELDIYIPSLKLAFELNGIFHYEPIFGADKLQQIQSNDTNKFQKCQELGISLCIIDTSSQKYVKEQTSKKFLDVITNIISGMTS